MSHRALDAFCLANPAQVFRDYGHALAPDGIAFIEDILDKHEIPDDDIETSTNWIARECSKQDGATCVPSHCYGPHLTL